MGNECSLESTNLYLGNTTVDPCLTNNPFSVGDEDPLSGYERVGRRIRVSATWYGPKNHGKPAASGRVYNAYERTIAVTRDLLGDIPLYSEVVVTYRPAPGVVRKVRAIVTDIKPKMKGSLDLSKAVMFALGGDNFSLFKKGRLRGVTIQRLKKKRGQENTASDRHLFIEFSRSLYASVEAGQKPPGPNPQAYGCTLRFAWDLAARLPDMVRRSLVPAAFVVHKYHPNGDTDFYVAGRLEGFQSRGDLVSALVYLRSQFPELQFEGGTEPVPRAVKGGLLLSTRRYPFATIDEGLALGRR